MPAHGDLLKNTFDANQEASAEQGPRVTLNLNPRGFMLPST